MNTLAERIQCARNKCSLTKVKFAKKLGVSFVTVYFWEIGKNKPNGKHILKIAEVCKVNTAWLQFGKGIRDLDFIQQMNIKLFPVLQFSEIEEWLQNPRLREKQKIIQLPPIQVSEKSFAFEVVGITMQNSHSPAQGVMPEEIVLVDPELEPKIGQLVLARFSEKDIRIRQLQIDGAQRFLKTFEPHLPPEIIGDQITIVGTIVGAWRNFSM